MQNVLVQSGPLKSKKKTLDKPLSQLALAYLLVTFVTFALFQVPCPFHELHESQGRETAAASGATLLL